MNIEKELSEIKRSIVRIDSKLTTLLAKTQKKETWVKVSFIADLTGWNGEKMRQAREQRIIKYRKSNAGGFEYLLESLPTQLIKGYGNRKRRDINT